MGRYISVTRHGDRGCGSMVGASWRAVGPGLVCSSPGPRSLKSGGLIGLVLLRSERSRRPLGLVVRFVGLFASGAESAGMIEGADGSVGPGTPGCMSSLYEHNIHYAK